MSNTFHGCLALGLRQYLCIYSFIILFYFTAFLLYFVVCSVLWHNIVNILRLHHESVISTSAYLPVKPYSSVLLECLPATWQTFIVHPPSVLPQPRRVFCFRVSLLAPNEINKKLNNHLGTIAVVSTWILKLMSRFFHGFEPLVLKISI